MQTTTTYSRRALRPVLMIMLLMVSLTAAAQGRSYIRNCISSWGDCRNVAITKSNGDVAIQGRNGYAVSDCPQNLVNKLKELNRNNDYIDDVQLSENGAWVILANTNDCYWYGVPYSLGEKLKNLRARGEVINSVTFNDGGDWVVITDNYISTSDSNVTEWLSSGSDDYGNVWTVCITDDAMVAVYDRGYKFLGNVPQSLKTALRNSSMDVYRLKIAGTAWFFADKSGNYNYNM